MGKKAIIPPYCLTLTQEGVHIEGHRGVEEYGAELISVRTKRKLITLRGQRLSLAAMDKTEILITGSIQDIEVSERGARA